METRDETSQQGSSSDFQFLKAQGERLMLYYEVVQGKDDSVFYFWEKDSLELKAQSKEIHEKIKAFAADPTQEVLKFPPLRPELRSQIYLSSKKFDLFTHSDGEAAGGSVKALNVYKEERVDDFSDHVKKFYEDESQTEIKFPPTLTSKERSIIHEQAKLLNLYSVSIGEGSKRCLVITKQKRMVTPQELNQRCRKIFLTLTGLPIPVTTSPHFDYFVDLYQPLLQSKDKLNEFLLMVDACGGESNAAQHYEDFKNNLKIAMKKTEAYKRFISEGMDSIKKKYHIPPETAKRFKRTKMIWTPANKDRYFLSLDLRSANFNCLRNHDPELVLGCSSWEELGATVTPHKFLVTSKFLRQLVMGSVKGKMQAPMWCYVTYRIYSRLIEAQILRDEDLVAFGGDEIIFIQQQHEKETEKEKREKECDEREKLKETYKSVRSFLAGDEELKRYVHFIKVEAFKLVQLQDSRFYVKEIYQNFDKEGHQDPYAFLPVIKCANSDEFAQCYKVYKGEPITEQDLVVSTGKGKLLFVQ